MPTFEEETAETEEVSPEMKVESPKTETETETETEIRAEETFKGQMDAVQKQIDDLKRQVAYSQSDFQNYRRRKEEEQRDIARFAKSELIRELLPVIDNFERAMQAAEKTQSFEALIGGVNGTFKQLDSFLHKAGLTKIEALGKEFDPNFHDAIGQVESEEYPANTVAEELQRGYLLNEKVLRPALVKVVG